MGWVTCFHASNWKYDRKGNRTVDRRKECDALYTWERKEPVVGADGHVYPKMKDTVLKSAWSGQCTMPPFGGSRRARSLTYGVRCA